MTTGKIPNDLLKDIVFKYIKHTKEEIITGAKVGEDNALVDFGEEIAVLSTDPITGAVNDIGRLAIKMSVNDVSTSGGEAIGVLITILAPKGTKYKDIEYIMKEAGEAAKNLDVEIMGGHTEITEAVNQVVISTTVLGKVRKENILDRKNVKLGDKILVTKSLGIEGTSILLNEYEECFKNKMNETMIQKGQKYGDMISVKKEGLLGGKSKVSYMHDITEGGLLGAVWEAHKALNKGIKIYEEKIPITDITKDMADILKINPLRLISSGSMLIIADTKTIKTLQKKLKEENIDSSIIGEVVEKEACIEKDGKLETIEPPIGDELYRAINKLK